jgi:hypothetical protein
MDCTRSDATENTPHSRGIMKNAVLRRIGETIASVPRALEQALDAELFRLRCLKRADPKELTSKTSGPIGSDAGFPDHQ